MSLDGINRTEREFVLNADGSILCDHKEVPVAVERFLASTPLRAEVSTRPGPGNKKLSYMSGDIITRTLNEAFGYDGWCLDVKDTTREENEKDSNGRYHVAYIATVRITHRRSGVYREDCGSGDAIDKSLGNACGNALKGAITDALKRAARHFGEKLGNSLYHDGFNVNKAPGTLKDALETLDIERAKSRFGFDKNRAVASQNASVAQSNVAKQATANRVINKPEIKAEPAQNKASNGYASTTSNMPNQSKVNPIGSTSATTNKYAGSNSAPPHTNAPSQYPNLITPAQKVGVNMTLNSANPADSNGRTNNVQRNSAPFPFSDYVATPAEINGNNAATLTSVEKAQSMTKGLDLPPRPNTSRGVTAVPIAGGGISFYGAVCAGNPNQPFYEQQGEPNTVHALKRKADQTQMSSEAPPTKAVGTGVRNPYNC